MSLPLVAEEKFNVRIVSKLWKILKRWKGIWWLTMLWTGPLFARFVTGCFQKEIIWLFISELTPVKNPLLVIFATIVRPRDQTWTPILELNIQMGCHGIYKISRHPILMTLFKKPSDLLIYLETQSVNKQLVSATIPVNQDFHDLTA